MVYLRSDAERCASVGVGLGCARVIHLLRHSRGALISCLLVGACSPAAPEWAAWTASPGVQTTVAVVRRPLGPPRATAGSPEQLPLFVLADTEATQLELLHYPQTLPELGLDPGELDSSVTCQRRCELTAPAARELYSLEAGRLERMPEPPALEDPVLDLLVPDRATRCGAQCLDLQLTVRPLEYQRFVRLTVPLPDGRIAVLQDDGSSLIVSSQGEMVAGCELPVPPGLDAYPAGTWTDPSGKVWVSLEDGSLLGVRLEELTSPGPCSVETATVGPGGRTLYHLAGNPDPEAPLEVVALTSDRSFWRLQGDRWQVLGRLSGEGPGLHKRADLRRTGGVFWLGPGRAAAFQWEQEILHVDGVATELIQVPSTDAGSLFIAGARSEEHGFLIGMRDLGVLRAQDLRGPWTLLPGYSAQRLASVVPFRGQLLLASRLQLEVYQDQLGPCDRVDMVNADYIRLVTPFPHAHSVLVGDYSESEPIAPYQRSVAIVRASLACD